MITAVAAAVLVLYIRLTEHTWFPVSDKVLHAFQGMARWKNKLPVGEVIFR